MKIDKNVPIPERYKSKWRKLADDMEAGDSVLIADISSTTRMRDAINDAGYKAVQRCEETGGYRMWKLEKD